MLHACFTIILYCCHHPWRNKYKRRRNVMKKALAILLILVMVMAVVACGSKKAEAGFDRSSQFITVGTGPTSGIYYPIGGAFATALKDYGYQTSAESTNATGQNIADLKFHNIRPPVVGVKLHLIAEEAVKNEE